MSPLPPGVVVPSEYSAGNLIAPPDKPEPTRQPAEWWDKARLLEELRWREEDFQAALLLGDPVQFPSSAKATRAGSFAWSRRWRDVDIEAWRARVVEHRALLSRLLRVK